MAFMEYAYYTADVFTQTRFGGNPLAVLPDARGIDDALMQTLAREFNYSETVFVLPPDNPAHTARLRIFTPGGELPFAGHPTVGTAFVLASAGLLTLTGARTDIVFEEGVGPVPVRIDREGDTLTACTLSVPRLPESIVTPPPAADVAAVLGLTPDDLAGEPECWSCGVPFLMVPLRSLHALSRAAIDTARWQAVLSAHPAHKVYPFVRDSATPDAHGQPRWHVRMFAPGIGVKEDAATGSAAASFAGWLHRHDLGTHATGTTPSTHRYTLIQGVDMGRPSELALELDTQDAALTAVRVGGASVSVMRGTLQT
jgi:trans-2,3-dihydro-3-hydroxyanthranilate isomerase